MPSRGPALGRLSWGGLLGGALLWGGCAPAALPEASDTRTLICDPLELAAGEVRAKQVGCTDELPRNGEGRVGDVLLQNALLSVIIRSPGEALSLVGAPGGTLVDAAPPGWNDRLVEAVPIINGQWMATQSWSWGADSEGAWVRLEGVATPAIGINAAALLDREGMADDGAQVSLTWRLPVDSQVLTIEGADGLYLHGDRGTAPVRAGIYHVGLGYLTDALSSEDLGGAVRFEGVSQLAVGRLHEVLGAAYPEGARASGACSGDRVRVVDDRGQALAYLDPAFNTPAPYDAAALICEAEGHDDGAPTAIGEDLSLSPGASGTLWARVSDEAGVLLPAVVEVDGVPYPLRPGGEALAMGPGVKQVRVHRGPAFDPWAGEVEVIADAQVELDLALSRAIDESGWILVDPWRAATPSREDRAEPSEDLMLAAASGVGFALQSAVDEVARPYTSEWTGDWIRSRAASRALTAEAGEVLSWPWSPNTRRSGHGAVVWFGRSASEVLANARGDGSPDRFTLVDMDWVAASGPVGGWDPSPELVAVRSLEELDAVMALLDAGARVGFVGPLAWAPVPAGEALASAPAVERGLIRGGAVATTGPLLTLARQADTGDTGAAEDSASDDSASEDSASEDSAGSDGGGGPLLLHLEARADARVERVDVYVDGALVWQGAPTRGRQLTLDATLEDLDGRWALAVAWGEDWALSAPVWLSSP